MEHGNFIKAKLATGATVLGTWSIIASPTLLEVMGSAGFDFVILDTEHGLYDLGALENGIRALDSVGCSPLVRVTQSRSDIIQNCLDMRCHGLVFPQVTSAVDAEDAVKACKYPPHGARGFNPFTRAGNYGSFAKPSPAGLTNPFGFTSIIIETPQAYAELDAILKIPGLDALYLGVYDMSVQMDCGGNVNHPRIAEFVADSIKRIRAAGKVAGVMVKTHQDMQKYVSMGANMLLYAVDAHIIAESVRAATSALAAVQR